MQKVARFLLCACLVLCTVAAAAAQTLTSDKPDYAPGETATLTGSGFIPNETVTLQVLHADGTPSTGEDHQPWTVTADGSGGFTATWSVCTDDCVGALLEATAVGQSGLHASVQFTDAGGTGVVTVTSVGGSCVSGTPPPGGGPFNWEVSEGGTYTMTITGVTECSGGAITVFAQGSGTGNFCFNLTGGSGTYSGTFTMPNPACNTYPLSYKCGANAPCNNSSTFAAKGPGGANTVHLRAATFNSSCVKTGNDVSCTGCTPTAPPTINCTSGTTDLHCNPTSLPECDPSITASDNCGPVEVSCSKSADQVVGCVHTRVITYTATNSKGTTTCVQTYTWTEDTTPPVLANLPAGGDLGCNPAPPACSATVTATDDCSGTLSVNCAAGPVTGPDCAKSQTFTYSATDGCGNKTSEDVTYTWKVDLTAPVLANLPASRDLGCLTEGPSCASDVTATDNCDGVVEVSCVAGAVSNVGTCGKSQTFTYSATDACGNKASQDVTLTWTEDSTPPVLANVPAGGDLGCNPETLPSCASDVTATDNCTADVTVSCTPGAVTGTDCNKSQKFTYSAKDACGNEVSQDVTYTWKVDTEAPVLANLPTGGDLGCNPPPPECDTRVTATDNCDESVVVNCTAGDVLESGCLRKQTFTYSATDACKNTVTKQVGYTWKEDNTPPVIQHLPVGGDLGCNPDKTKLPTCANLFATDNCSVNPRDGTPILIPVSCSPGPITGTDCLKRQVFTYKVSDDCKNVTSEDVVYTWTTDTRAPVLANLPAGGDLGCNPTPPSCSPDVTATDNCDESVVVVCVSGDEVVDGCMHSQKFTYSAKDACGNGVSQDVNYTWKVDTTKPVLANLPAGGDLGCNPATPPSCASDVTATDDCDGTLHVDCAVGAITNVGTCGKSQTFTYSAKDACGNEESQAVTYTWTEDTTKPVLANLPAGGDLGCNPTPPSCSSEVTATDNCDESVRVTCVSGDVVVDGCLRHQKFTYSAKDACGNEVSQDVNYTWKVDTTKPVLANLPAGGDLGCNPATPPSCASDVTATDDCDGTLHVDCAVGAITNVGTCGKSQTFTYSAKDACGNEESQAVTYTWTVDTTPPVLANVPAGGDLGCNPTPPSCSSDVTATDNCDESVRVTCVSGDVVVDGCLRHQKFTYSAKDACGNPVSQDVNYTWKVDTTKPVLANLPAGGDLGCNPATPPSCSSLVTATDDCDGSLTVSCNAGPVTGTDCNKSQIFTYSAKDGCGNEVSQTVTYTWKVDTTKPVVTCTDITVTINPGDACPTLVNFTNVSANDNCDGPVSFSPTSGTYPPGTTSVTVKAVDACGNEATCTFNVIVKTAVCVIKYNDYNANGNQDAGEPGVAGVTFTLNPGGATAVSDATGKACFTGLTAGNYTVTETLPSGWLNISPVSQNVTLGCPTTLKFGNVKLGGCGGLTLGYWSNKNGQALETSGDFATLTALCLRNADGSNRDFTGMLAANKAAFNSWILSANATNMANMLSAQLAAMRLNVAHGFVSGTALVYTPGCGNTGPGNNFISINDLMTAANNELCAHPVTLSGSPFRAAQECLKIALDSANNNLNFIVTPNCPSGSTSTGRNNGSTM